MKAVSIVKKSQATMPFALGLRNSPQLGAAPRGRVQTGRPQDRPDRGGGDGEAKLCDGRASRSPDASVGPLSPHKFAMPAKKGLRRDEKRIPGGALEQAAGCGEEHAVAAAEPRTGDLAAEDPKLVPEHQQLDLGGSLENRGGDHEPEDGTEDRVEE
jgi:hypothetical protein